MSANPAKAARAIRAQPKRPRVEVTLLRILLAIPTIAIAFLVAPLNAHAADTALHWVEGWLNRGLIEIGGVKLSVIDFGSALLILVGAWTVSLIVRRGLERLSRRRPADTHAAFYAIGRLLHYTLLVVGLMIALSTIGVDVGKVTLLVTALGVGLGFGLQQIINNLVSGLILLFEQSLKIGDFVELSSGARGEVKEINIRSTRITTNDNIDIVVPNSDFVSGTVTNWTLREASCRLRIPFGVAYGSDKEVVKKAALEAATEVPFTLHMPERRRPQVWLTGFGDSSLNFELVVWLGPAAVKRPRTVIAAYNWAIESALGRYGLEIPFPQRDLNVRTLFGLNEAEALAALGLTKGIATVESHAHPKVELESAERRELQKNDAVADAQREIDADREAKEQEARELEGRGPGGESGEKGASRTREEPEA